MLTKQNRNHGSILLLVVAAALVLTLTSVSLIFILQLLSGARGLQNVVDSGALNMAKKALVLPTSPIDLQSIGRNFVYYVDNEDNNCVTLRHLNRIWAHALLVGMNAEAMTVTGNAGPDTVSHAQEIHGWALSRNSELVNAIYAQVQAHYHAVADSNSLRVLQSYGFTNVGHARTVWPTGFVDRGEPSQMYIEQGQVPGRSTFDFQASTGTQGSRTRNYLKGYQRIHVNSVNRDYIFVPYRLDDQPHLISKQTFDANDSVSDGPLTLDGTNAVPNAFYVDCLVTNPTSNLALTFQAFSQSDIVTGDTPATIAGGFLRIENWTDENKAPWEFMHNEPLIGGLTSLIIQRVRQIWTDFDASNDHSQVAGLLGQFTIPAGQSAIICGNIPFETNLRLRSKDEASQSDLPGPYIDQKPDGILNKNGPDPSLIEIGSFYRFAFYPSSGYNNLLGVLVISPKDKPPPPVSYMTYSQWKSTW